MASKFTADLSDWSSDNILNCVIKHYISVYLYFRGSAALAAFPNLVEATGLLDEVFGAEVQHLDEEKAKVAFHWFRDALQHEAREVWNLD